MARDSSPSLSFLPLCLVRPVSPAPSSCEPSARFEVVGQRGSHVRLRRPGSDPFVIVPVHAGKIIGAGLLAAILEQAGVGVDDLRHA